MQTVTERIRVPQANTIGVGLVNESNYYIDDNRNEDKCTRYCNYSIIILIVSVTIAALIAMGWGVITVLKSDHIVNFTHSVQEWHKSKYNNTKIDPDILRKLHHQKTVEKVASRRIPQRPINRLSIYDTNVDTDIAVNNKKNHKSKKMERNYETLRQTHKKKEIYLGHKRTHPALLQKKQKAAQVVQAMYAKKHQAMQNLLNRQNEHLNRQKMAGIDVDNDESSNEEQEDEEQNDVA